MILYRKNCLMLLCFAGLVISQNADGQRKKAAVSETKPVVVVKDSIPPPKPERGITDSFLVKLLRQYPEYFDSIFANRKALNVQFIYTKIDRGSNGNAALRHYFFNVDPHAYFYPGAAVMLPVSFLTMQKLGELKSTGIDKNTTMITDAGYNGQTAVLNDPTTPDGKPNIAHYLKKMLMAGDNDAHNRLYEFLGQQYINEQLRQKGYVNAQLLHRLDLFLTADENRHTNPVRFLNTDGKLMYDQPMQVNTTTYAERHDSLGKSYYSNEKLYKTPLSFSQKSRLSLQDLHNMLISLVFPSKVPETQRFIITEDDRKFLLKYMSQLPGESNYPPYAGDSNYFPGLSKYLLHGAQRGDLPKNIRIFNRVGDGYGQLLDVAYITDFDKKIEFFLSAVIYCNSDGILNDDKYDYDDVGFPFLEHLGQVIYDYELKREKKVQPDLNELIFEYDKKL